MTSKKTLTLFTAIMAIWSCSKAPQLSEDQKKEYLKQGGEIVSRSAKTISTNLTAAMADGGIEEALKFCNTNAIPITDSLSKAEGYSIKRTALKLRNPANKPSQREKMVLNMFKEATEKGNEIKPVLDLHENGAIYYYAPIKIQPMCLNCHGEPGKNISEANFNLIKTLYPRDKAMGFKEGDLRGMWSIGLKKSQISRTKTQAPN